MADVAARAAELIRDPATPARAGKKQLADMLGCSPSYVTKMIALGKLPPEVFDGPRTIRVREALQAIVATADPARSAVGEETEGEAPELPGLDGYGDGFGDDKGPGEANVVRLNSDGKYKAARADMVSRRAALLEIELARKTGEVLDRERTLGAVADRFGALRDAVFAIARKVAPELAAVEDQARCETIVTAALREVFQAHAAELKRAFGGAAEEGERAVG